MAEAFTDPIVRTPADGGPPGRRRLAQAQPQAIAPERAVSRVSGRYGRHFCGCSLETPGFGGPDSLDGSKLGSSISFNYHHPEIADGIAKAHREGVGKPPIWQDGWRRSCIFMAIAFYRLTWPPPAWPVLCPIVPAAKARAPDSPT